MPNNPFSGGLKKKATTPVLSGNPFVNRPPAPAPPIPTMPAGGAAQPAGSAGAATPVPPPPAAPNTMPNAVPPPKAPKPLVKPNATLPNIPKKKKKS